MRLTRLRLEGFRNLRDADLALPGEGVALIGRNAQGKTNLLEAVHYLEMFRSFRGSRDEDLIRFGGDFFRLEGVVEEAGASRSVAAAFRLQPRQKRIAIDGVPAERLADAVGLLATVLFTPDDVRLVRDGPAERRRFLDTVLSLNEPSYLRALRTFRQALSQRNAALRSQPDSEAVFAWDPTLMRSGGEVVWFRIGWVTEHAESFGERYSEIAGGHPASLAYLPSISEVDATSSLEEMCEAYGEALAASRRLESRRRITLVGPHRDDMVFSADDRSGGRDLRAYGSGGEQRTVALALRLLEVETARARRRHEPILLLDDVFAELDEERSSRVLQVLDRLVPGQVLLSAPKESDVRFRGQALDRWRIEAGEILC